MRNVGVRTSTPAIDVAGLCKEYSGRRVVDDVTFSIERGETVALLGHNGAGKTTTVEMIEGLRRRTSGSVRVLGVDPLVADASVRDRVAVVLQETAIWGSVTVAEALDVYAALYTHPWDTTELLGAVGLDAHASARVRNLSGGQRRRLDLALGLVGHPEVLFLDEPTTGFDPAARREAWQFLRGLRDTGTTILLTTHYMDEAEHLADRMLVMSAGRLIAEGTSADLSRRIGARSVITFRVDDHLIGALPRVDGRVDTFGDRVEVRTADPTATLHTLTKWALDHETVLDEITVTRPSLEDVYLELTVGATTGERRDA
jgi:ABC-2 type transport system ATP-binding protein